MQGLEMAAVRRVVLAGLIAILAFCVSAQAARAATTAITVDPGSPGAAFDGVGALSAGASSRLLRDYPEPQRSQVLDYLFKPDYGASLQILKVEIGGDTNSTDGSESSHMHSADDLDCNRGYEWWLMREAMKRNPHIKLAGLAWGAPGWIGNGNFFSQDNIDYQLKWLGCARRHGLRIDNIGIWNERAYDATWIKQLRAALDARGYEDVRIVAADDCCGSQWDIAADMARDPELKDAVDVVGAHYPNGQSSATARALGKTLWASEDGPWSSAWGATGPSASIPALLNRNYISGHMTATQIWSPVTAYYDGLGLSGSGLFYANTPWSGAYSVRSAVWAMAHTSQFAQPGWRYIDSASGYLAPGDVAQGSYVTLHPAGGGDYSTIIETMGASAPRTLDVSLAPAASTGTVHVWRTNRTQWFEHIADIQPQHGKFSLTVDPRSLYTITTTTGQHKGTAVGRHESAFPFPYADDFDKTGTNRQPRYFSQQMGSFEAAPCGGGRTGRCVEQTVSREPIRWCCGSERPHGVIGDLDWRDYRVSTDVRLDETGSAEVLGRTKFSTYGVEDGYRVVVAADGTWKLTAHVGGNVIELASGTTGSPLSGWHRVGLTMAGEKVTAELDGKTLAAVQDDRFQAGWAGLGTGWNRAQFDNLKIEPVKPITTVDDATIGDGLNAFTYSGSGWHHWSGQDHTVSTTSTPGDSATLRFRGSQVTLYAYGIDGDGSSAAVQASIDGGSPTTIGFAGRGRDGRVWQSRVLSAGEHTLKLTLTGGTVALDRVDVLPPSVPSSSVDDQVTGTGPNEFHYVGNWLVASGDGSYDNSFHYSNTPGDYFTFSFTGTRISLYGLVDGNQGIAEASIDGGPPADVDFYGTPRRGNVLLWESPLLDDGPHTLKVTVTNRANPAATPGGYVVPDRVRISPAEDR